MQNYSNCTIRKLSDRRIQSKITHTVLECFMDLEYIVLLLMPLIACVNESKSFLRGNTQRERDT